MGCIVGVFRLRIISFFVFHMKQEFFKYLTLAVVGFEEYVTVCSDEAVLKNER